MPTKTDVGVAVLTLNGAHHLEKCLPPLINSSLNPRVLVIDSSSDDASVACAKNLGAETLVIPRATFNHGATRELARLTLNTPIVAMVTQDAYAIDDKALNLLVEPLYSENTAVSYGRQMAHQGANFYETFHRQFNYPLKSHHRSLADIAQYGKYTFFCSNSFAAYRNAALDAIGGFENVLFGEDTVAVAHLLRKGYSIAYVAEAIVTHSHNYTLKQEFKRHFDIGYSRKQSADLLNASENDLVRGKAYASSLMRELWKQSPLKLPYASALLTVKWLGYQLGSRALSFPNWINCSLSSHKNYFM